MRPARDERHIDARSFGRMHQRLEMIDLHMLGEFLEIVLVFDLHEDDSRLALALVSNLMFRNYRAYCGIPMLAPGQEHRIIAAEPFPVVVRGLFGDEPL